MKKKRLLGIIMMIAAGVIGIYGGIWNLFIQSCIDLIKRYSVMNLYEIAFAVTKVFIFFPMVMILSLVIIQIGEMLFRDE